MSHPPEEYYPENYSQASYSQGASSQQSESLDYGYPNWDDALRLGENPVADRMAAERLMQDPDRLLHAYAPDSGLPIEEGRILTGNESCAPEVSYRPDWSPPFEHLRDAPIAAMNEFPLTSPGERNDYEESSTRLIDARVQQDLSRTAWGSLEEVGESYDPNDIKSQYALETSVHSAFNVMTSATEFTRRRAELTDAQARAQEEEIRKQIRANEKASRDRKKGESTTASGSSTRGKRHRESSSSSSDKYRHGQGGASGSSKKRR